MNAPIRIKSFRARTLSDAIRQIRSELGPDAVILETKPVGRSRLPWSRARVEVTASCGRVTEAPTKNSDDWVSSEPASTGTGPSGTGTNAPSLKPADPDSHPASNTVSPSFMQRSSLDLGIDYPEVFMEVASHLLLQDLPADRIEIWLRGALMDLGSEVEDPWLVRAYVAQRLRSEIETGSPTSDWVRSPSLLAVVGPSGHGKSSAVAKLASLAAVQYRLRPLILACTHGSAPMHPRLAEYCSLMGWGYEQVDAPKLPSAVSAGIERGEWLILDIPGIPLGDGETIQGWRSLLANFAISQTHLVLSATTGTTHARRLLDWYQALSPSHLLATHVDEARGLGSFYPFLRSARLPVGFASFGPKVPEDIQECDAARLAQWMFGIEGGPWSTGY